MVTDEGVGGFVNLRHGLSNGREVRRFRWEHDDSSENGMLRSACLLRYRLRSVFDSADRRAVIELF